MRSATAFCLATFTALALGQVQLVKPHQPGRNVAGVVISLEAQTTPGELAANRKISKEAGECLKAARKLADEGATEQAVAQYERASNIILAVSERQSDHIRAEAFVVQERYQDAVAIYNGLFAKKPNGFGQNALAGLAYAETHDYARAMRILASAMMSLHPVGPEIGNENLPTAKGSTDKHMAATAYLLAARQAEGYLGQPKLALRYLEKANRLAPNNAAICFLTGKLLVRFGKYKEARPYLETAVDEMRSEESRSIEEMLKNCRHDVRRVTATGG